MTDEELMQQAVRAFASEFDAQRQGHASNDALMAAVKAAETHFNAFNANLASDIISDGTEAFAPIASELVERAGYIVDIGLAGASYLVGDITIEEAKSDIVDTGVFTQAEVDAQLPGADDLATELRLLTMTVEATRNAGSSLQSLAQEMLADFAPLTHLFSFDHAREHMIDIYSAGSGLLRVIDQYRDDPVLITGTWINSIMLQT